MMDTAYAQKYFKYKEKYLRLKEKSGGSRVTTKETLDRIFEGKSNIGKTEFLNMLVVLIT